MKKTKEQELLFELRDEAYADFTAKCIPNIDRDRFIGVRSPEFKKFFAQYKKRSDAMDFLEELPHYYQEENLLHGSLICSIKDYDECIRQLDRFLPYVDNWAVCDGMSPKCFLKNKDKLWVKINEWIKSEHTYMIRFAIKSLFIYLKDDDFDTKQLDLVASVKSEEYYIKMMVAWYFATALAFQYDKAVTYIENNALEEWERKKSIQKAVESYRVTDEHKEYLKSLRKNNVNKHIDVR